MISVKKNYSKISWRRINMRNVVHLLGVEFIHDLYNRHLPRINSIRFRNTITTWKNGIVNSFAPEEEWEILREWFGEKFIRCDPVLLKEVKRLINNKFYYYRLMILDEIARRKLENCRALDYYLLSEILKLLSRGKKLPLRKLIFERPRV